MKIKCEYCENFFDDTLEQCPHCGAPNKNVRRSTADQPVTVEELKEWYTKQGLPPAEVTRFFIGEDYKDPKAFGIYKDASTGNFVVYKNKADGSRAVRYEGTDEAFAVNEIFMRLKQEILEQKAHNLKSDSKANSSGNGVSETGTSQEASKTGKSSKPPKWLIIVLVAIFGQGVFFVAFMIFSLISGMVKGFTIPNTGYYQKDGQTYYYYSESNHDVWAVYDNNDWVETEVNGELLKWKTAKPYYKGNAFNDGLGTSDFTQSILYDDVVHECTQGYYRAEDRDYYYLPSEYGGWYYYNDSSSDWSPISKDELPADLKHTSTAQNFWYTPTWDSNTQIKDFETTSYYSEYEDKTSSHSDSSDSDYSWDSGDSWDSGGTDWDSDW